jgi:hypothetical protein
MNPIRRLVAAIALAWPLLSAQASGGGMSEVLASVPKGQPEQAAVSGYLHGHLGVLWPTYDRGFLMAAYRQAAGHAAMSASEAASWVAPPPSATLGDDWLAARRQAGAADEAGSTAAGERPTSPFSYAGNCLPDAFGLAAATLRARVKAHAGEPAAIRDWIAGQDAVFAACDHPDALAPAEVPGDAPAWLRADRAYQRAASQLYLGHADDADAAFAAIAASASPWRDWAAFLQARLWWRGTFKEAADYRQFATRSTDWRREPVPAQLLALSASARDPAVRDAAAALLRTVQARIEPVEVHRALWRRIDAAEPPADFDAWVADERFLWALMKDDDALDDWLFLTRSVGSGGAPGLRAADLGATWTKHPTHAWLALALLAAHPDTPGLESAVAASRALKPDDPIYLHCVWQRARLAFERHDLADARRELADARTRLDGEAAGTRQAFDQLEMLAATSLPSLGEHLQRRPLALDDYEDDTPTSHAPPAGAPQAFIDDDTRAWLAARLDGAEMLELARDARLAKNVRLDLTGGAWLRAALLRQDTLDADAVKLLASMGVDADAAAAATPPERRFRMARHLLLHEVPAIGIDTTPDSSMAPWWLTSPSFHDAAAVARIEQLRQALSASNQTTWIGQAMLPWLRAHKSAEGPALLEKLVYASRYGPSDTKTSRAAFQLLHAQYPNSPEAMRTQYYF